MTQSSASYPCVPQATAGSIRLHGYLVPLTRSLVLGLMTLERSIRLRRVAVVSLLVLCLCSFAWADRSPALGKVAENGSPLVSSRTGEHPPQAAKEKKPLRAVNRGPSEDQKIFKDFSGRPIPRQAHELINLSLPADIPWRKTVPLPGWTYRDDVGIAGQEFVGFNAIEMLDAHDLKIEMVYKKGYRVGLIRKFFPDRSWQILDLFHHEKNERMTEICDPNGHVVPPGYILVGILRRDDPHKPPIPRRPNVREAVQYSEENFGRFHPRSCIGDTQKAHLAALLNLNTGKLTQYTDKPVICISPFFDPCAPYCGAEIITKYATIPKSSKHKFEMTENTYPRFGMVVKSAGVQKDFPVNALVPLVQCRSSIALFDTQCGAFEGAATQDPSAQRFSPPAEAGRISINGNVI